MEWRRAKESVLGGAAHHHKDSIPWRTHGPHVEPHASPALGTRLHHPWTSPGHHLVSKSNAHFASITLPDLSAAYGKLMFPCFATPFPWFP